MVRPYTEIQKKSSIIPFILGLVLGVLLGFYVPKFAAPLLPSESGMIIRGHVAAKERQGDNLLVTVNTPTGSVLATFTKNADDVNRLINEKDEVELRVREYTPFVSDPPLTRVIKGQEPITPEAGTATVEPERPAKRRNR